MADSAHSLRLPQRGVASELLSIIFPVRCVHCGAAGDWLCPKCAAAMEPTGPHQCYRCGRPSAHDIRGCPECRRRELYFTGASAAFRYDGPARSLVHRLKYSGQRRLATFMAAISAPALFGWLSGMSGMNNSAAAFCDSGAAGLTGADPGFTLTFVPSHSSKLVSRGYNQAGIYARALARVLGLPLYGLLSRRFPTTPQNRLDFDQRRQNLHGSILPNRRARMATGSDGVLSGAAITGLPATATTGATSRVILIDDVYTTGATAAECARILNQVLGVQVYIWTFARTVRRQPIRSRI